MHKNISRRAEAWPFIPPALIEAPDLERIESLGIAALNRALNLRSRRVIAFLGAGVSMSYGRISWQDLNYSMQKQVMARFSAINPNAAKESKSALYDHMLTLYKTLVELKISRRSTIASDRLPTIFQLCDNLDTCLDKWHAQQKHPRADSGTQNTRDSAFRRLVIEMTQDDRGHAKQIISDALLDTSVRMNRQEEVNHEKLMHALSSHYFESKDHPTRYRELFTRDRTIRLIALVEATLQSRSNAVKHEQSPLQPLVQALSEYVNDNRWTASSNLLPMHRYLIGVLLRMLPKKQRKAVLGGRKLRKSFITANGNGKAARYEIVPRTRDPLAILHHDFEISRFITTNYDNEVETMFRDHGYSVIADDRRAVYGTQSIDPLQPIAKEIVFSNHNAGHLVAFSVQEGEGNAGVVHLHGKATPGGEIIATEGDYQRRYLRLDSSRPLIDEAIGLAFAANPIIFVGSGMGEDDILRPLRNFMSTPARHGNRLAVAFLPALSKRDSVSQQQLMLLQRYGIHAVYFGWARVAPDKTPSESAREKRETAKRVAWAPIEKTHAMWLPEAWAIKEAIEGVLNLVDEPEKFFEMLMCAEKLRAFKSELALANQKIIDGLKSLEKLSGTRTDDSGSQSNGQSGNVEARSIATPTDIEGTSTADAAPKDIQIRLEVAILNAAITFLKKLKTILDSESPPASNAQDDEKWCAIRRSIKAYRSALAGAGDGIIAAFLCARLKRARDECQAWNDDWFRVPEPREVLSAPREVQLGGVDTHVVERHALHLTDGPPEESSGSREQANPREWLRPANRFRVDAPSQALNALVSAIAEQSKIAETPGRRLLLLIARRGVGKGHFFACLQSASHLERLRKSLGQDQTQWLHAAFFNLSFSHEVGSVFDRIAELLHEFVRERVNELPPNFAHNWRQLANDRLGQLHFILSTLRQEILRDTEKKHSTKRIFIAVNCLNILFDPNGQAKNGQIKRWLDTFLSAEFAMLPIDLLFVCSEDAIPHYFRKNASTRTRFVPPLVNCVRQELSEKGLRAIRQRTERLQLNVSGPSGQPEGPAEQIAVLHFMKSSRASLLTGIFFPDVALIMARDTLARIEGATVGFLPQAYSNIYRPSANQLHRQKIMDLVIGITEQSKCAPLTQGGLKANSHLNTVLPFLTIATAVAFNQHGRLLITETDFEKVITNVLLGALQTESKENLQHELAEILHAQCKLSCSLETFIAATAALDERMKEMYEIIGSSRFALTILMTTVSELIVPRCVRIDDESARGQPDIAIKAFDEATTQGLAFIDEIRRETKAVAEGHRSDFVMGKVLAKLKEQHTVEAPLPIDQPRGLIQHIGLELFDLQDTLLWHLAMIGQPVEYDVLARCPLVQLAVDRVLTKPEEGGWSDTVWIRNYELAVEWTLDLMVHRCLVHQIKPTSRRFYQAPHEVMPPSHPKRRFALHRLLQKHILRRMGSPFVEYPESDQLAATLYASHPRTLPRLSVKDHEELRETVAALSGYPDGNRRNDYKTPPAEHLSVPQAALPEERDAIHFFNRDLHHDLQRRMLRAALGIVRSVYSASSVIRFDLSGESGEAGRQRDEPATRVSLLDDHRYQVRWLLKQAVELGRARMRKEDAKQKPGATAAELAWNHSPFYREEVISLFNECDLFGVIAGYVCDAAEPFERALKAARRVEPDLFGPLHIRILLNASLCDIERGRFNEARQTLSGIVAAERRSILDQTDREPQCASLPSLIAKGYLGLVEHLSGDRPQAHKLYREAYKGVLKLGQLRSASIFARHWADLYRQEDTPQSREESAKMVSLALSLARDCGHEDIRHLAILSAAKLKLLENDLKHYPQIHLDLNSVERYARITGMQRLECEVTQIRAILHERSGDMITAGAQATQSLEIATRCDLRIRTISNLSLLARINHKRGQPSAAIAMLEEAMTMARACDWNAGLSMAQRLLSKIVAANAGI